jgi:hypothetical protein
MRKYACLFVGVDESCLLTHSYTHTHTHTHTHTAMSDSSKEHENNVNIHESFHRKLTIVLLNVGAISLLYVLMGTLFFAFQEDIGVVDALYFCVITLTTVVRA